jgi:hypothetical protein
MAELWKEFDNAEEYPQRANTPTPQTFANVPLRAGAVEVVDWCDDARYFKGSSWVVERNDRRRDIHVYIDGLQRLDGRVERYLYVSAVDADEPLTVDEALRFAEVLVAAAAEVNQMSQYDQVVVS